MINTIKSVAGVSDRPSGRKSDRDGEGAYSPGSAEAPPQRPASGSDLRLVIERDGEGAYYVYKLIDRITGELVAELPRDQVASLAAEESYAAGAVVCTKA